MASSSSPAAPNTTFSLLSTLFAINHWNALVCLLLGLSLNTLLLLLLVHVAARHNSSAQLRHYHILLRYFCTLNMLTLLLHAFAQPLFFVSDANLDAYIFLQGISAKIDSVPFQFAIWHIYYYLLLLNTTSMGWLFLSRFLAICRREWDGTKWSLIWIGLGLAILLLLLHALIASAAMPSEDIGIGQLLLGMAAGNSSSAGAIPSAKIAARLNAQNSAIRIGLSLTVLTFLACYLTAIICFCKIRSFLAKNLLEQKNSKKRDLIRQISRNMLVQAFLPAFCIGIGIFCLAIILSGQHSANLLQLEMLAFLPQIWLLALNPLITILSIGDYRRATVAFLLTRTVDAQERILYLPMKKCKRRRSNKCGGNDGQNSLKSPSNQISQTL